MKRPLRVYVPYLQPINAITHHRSLQLLKILERQEKVVILNDDFHPSMTQERRSLTLQNADMAFAHCVPSIQAFRDYERMRTIPPTYSPEDRTVKYPPQWVMDIDDVYDWVSPTNPSFSSWGVRDLDGNLIETGGRIVAVKEGGVEETLFEDGQVVKKDPHGNIFSLDTNYKRLAKLKTAINQVACVTVTTEYLKSYVEQQNTPRRVEVIPNCMWRAMFPTIELQPHKGIRVLWHGGSSHYDDWLSLRQGLRKAAEKYPEVTWVFYGQDYDFMFEGIKNRERHEWVDHGAHYLKLATIDYDINIIPLVENKFNLGKSALKWYESSALNKPVCTLAADVGPYKEIEHGKTGLLFNGEDDFVEKIGALIESEKLRRELAQNAHDWVWENRDAEKWAPKLLELFVGLREDYIQEIGDLRELIGASEEVIGHTMSEQNA